jgi:tRNA-modifying protein YgfZ
LIGGHLYARLFSKKELDKMESHIRNIDLSIPVYIEQPLRGVLILSGKDRLDFLQRQTTNDASQITRDKILTSALTSPTGRILDVLHLFEEEEQGEARVFAISLPGRAAATSTYFKSRIFFMDQVEVKEAGADYANFELAGQGIERFFSQLRFPTLPEGEKLVSAEFEGKKLITFQPAHRLGIGYQMIVPYEQRERVQSMLEEFDVLRLTLDEYEILRVETGIPAVDRELTEEYTPLEVNLEEVISIHKGCYTGQEVIARQMNYDKVTKNLVGLYLEKDAGQGSQLQAEGKPAGKVTSCVRSPRFGPIALAMVKRPFNQDGTELIVKDGEIALAARVTSLPFRK